MCRVSRLLQAARLSAIIQAEVGAETVVNGTYLSGPVVSAACWQVAITSRSQSRCGQHARGEPLVLIVAQFLRPDRRVAGDKHEFVLRAQLHDLTGRQQRSGSLLEIGRAHV